MQHILRFAFAVAILTSVFFPEARSRQAIDVARSFRPAATPLITCDPYFSIWSMSDRLTDDWPRHWTGAVQALDGMMRIDGHCYRVMGPAPADLPAMRQIELLVRPTRTVYRFEDEGVRLTLTFLAPLLPSEIELISRPVTYLTWEVQSIDGKTHNVALYFDNTAELVVNTPDQKVVASRYRLDSLLVLSMGSQDQEVLKKSGDDLRIDWGYLHVGIPKQYASAEVISGSSRSRRAFADHGILPGADDMRFPRAANDDWPVLAVAFDLGPVGPAMVSRHLLLCYDDGYSIEYFNRKLRPYWRRGIDGISELLERSEAEYPSLVLRCKAFDESLAADLTRLGGEAYEHLAILAYRQCLAAHKLAVDFDGTPLLFPKENFSNGCISTVDVLYPSSPLLLLFNTDLLKAALTPVLTYASSERWRFPFAPHDLGTYPLANGQVYGGGELTEENQMPVEECGNMILMMAAMAHIDGNAEYARRYWPALSKWAAYLRDKGLDPENQLCTDDFAGHLAHNANLSIKAILAMGGYAMLCDMIQQHDEAEQYRKSARAFAMKWETMANDGDHYRLAFDKPGTWSQKYNLVWDKLLGLNLFPPEIAKREIAFYLTHQNRYGLPLDNRQGYTKLDWLVWTATLAGSSRDFDAIVSPALAFVNDSPSRVPLTDWYSTIDAKQIGFQGRSVVGGLFVKMLSDRSVWRKWALKPHEQRKDDR
jgi:hypothetical protein